MTDQQHEKLIDKIRKLVALSRSPNENEAASAAEKVQALLAEYNLTMSEVETKPGKDQRVVMDNGEVTTSRPWRRTLGSAVAKLYFCQYFYTFEKQFTPSRACGYIRYDTHTFVGALHNVTVAKLMFSYLHETVDRMAVTGSKSVPVKERTSYVTSFKTACAARLTNRVLKRWTEARKGGTVKSETGTNLPALANLYDQAQAENDEFIASAVGKLKTSKTKMILNHERGSADGLEAGDQIGLDNQITGKTGHLLPGPNKALPAR